MLGIPNMLLLLSIMGVLTSTALSDFVVMTKIGPIRGVTVSREKDMVVEAFLSIPYAEPPVGDRRFARPLPKKPWSDIYEANKQLPACSQNSSKRYFEPNIDYMSEDCLYINLWVPYSRRTKGLKPIVVFTHGGAFNIGSANMPIYDGTNLARFGDVIVATLNYRVGSLGFFAAFIDEAAGNMGVYDQALATTWIKENACHFGGDPDHIVQMGESAGGMIAGGYFVSPLARNMFKRVIMQSGAPPMPVLLDENERLFNVSQMFAERVGCADKSSVTLKNSPKVVVECMKRLPVERLTETEGLMIKQNPLTFFPRVGDEAMPKPAIHLLREGEFQDREMLIGVNELEGSFFLTAAAPDYFGVFGKGRANSISKRLANYLVRFIFKFTEQKNETEIANHYINTIRNGTADTYTEGISRALGDYLTNCASYFHAEFHSVRNPVYYYVFNKKPATPYNAPWMKTTHFDELQYVFGNPLFDNFTAEEAAFSEKIMARWVSFIKTGNPNIPGRLRWPKFTRDDPEYLEIDDEEAVRLRPEKSRCEFWRKRFQAEIDDKIISKIKGSANSNSRQSRSWPQRPLRVGQRHFLIHTSLLSK